MPPPSSNPLGPDAAAVVAQGTDHKSDPISLARAAAERISELSGSARHDIAIVLGTGLASASDNLGTPSAAFSFSQVPGFPPTVPSNQRAEALSIVFDDLRLLVMQGRPHLYEGHSPYAVVHPVRAAVFAGCEIVVITNLSGALREDLAPGDLVLISDHLNLTGVSPLTGTQVTGVRAGAEEPNPFVDLTEAWSQRLRDLARGAGDELSEGVYAQVPGPQFETPAEIRMLSTLGADMVGMSSVLEAIAARHLGAEVLGISLVSNLGAGLGKAVSLGSVLSAAHAGAGRLGELLRSVVPRL
jgi:purine-nucleoside phosphorylase